MTMLTANLSISKRPGKPAVPDYFLFLGTDSSSQNGRWSFRLVDETGRTQIEIDDIEPGVRGERLELLTAVRALECLDRPSKVLLLTRSAYVREGFRSGLQKWRQDDWKWEYYDRMVPIRDSDLWRRVDRALRYHQVDCRLWRCDNPHNINDDVPASGKQSLPNRAARPHADFASSGGRTREMDEIVLGNRAETRQNTSTANRQRPNRPLLNRLRDGLVRLIARLSLWLAQFT